MNYPFKDATLAFVKGGDARTAAHDIMRICEHYPAPALHVLMNFMSTHDTVRAITAIAGESCEGRDRYWQSARRLTPEQYENGRRLMTLAYAMIFTLPGIPSIYYGDEIGMQGYKDPFNRAFFDWESRETRIRPVLQNLAALRKKLPRFCRRNAGRHPGTGRRAVLRAPRRSRRGCRVHQPDRTAGAHRASGTYRRSAALQLCRCDRPGMSFSQYIRPHNMQKPR